MTRGPNREARKALFGRAACGLALFPSRFKLDSRAGGSRFWAVRPGPDGVKSDFELILPRTGRHGGKVISSRADLGQLASRTAITISRCVSFPITPERS